MIKIGGFGPQLAKWFYWIWDFNIMKTLTEFNEWVENENKKQFDFEHFKTIEEVEQLIDYCYDTLGQTLGRGSGRIVWALDENRIVKITRSKESKQNETEFNNSMCVGKEFAVEVLDYDIKGFKWLIEERTQTLSNEQFVIEINKKLGTDFSNYFDIIDMINDYFQWRQLRKRLITENEWFRTFLKKMAECKAAIYDVHPGNWGIRPSTGELILIDLGF
jgi:hypothetical protein